MIKHLVFWRLKASAHGQDKTQNARLIKEKLESLRQQIPGLLHIEVGIDFSTSESSSDLALYSEFTDRQALEDYQHHPAHQAITPFIREACEERRVVDYVI